MASLHPQGWKGVRRSNRELCLAGRDILIESLGIDQPAPDDMIGAIASVPLPDSRKPAGNIFDPLMAALRSKWNIEAMVFTWPSAPQRLLRISAQQYNRIDEFHRLAQAVNAELSV